MLLLLSQAVQKRVKWFTKSKRDALWERTHQRNAKRVLNLILKLEGLWVKLGQYLSTRADVLPEAYISLLKQLQDSLPPRPLKEVTYANKKKFYLCFIYFALDILYVCQHRCKNVVLYLLVFIEITTVYLHSCPVITF